jgi:predicted O-methyltransferase YrrM
MEPELRTFLSELHASGQAHDESQPDHYKKMLNLEPDTALLMSILVRSSRRRQLLEIGTSNGYSTIWLAWAAAPCGGRVLSIDFNPEKHARADANLHRANLRHVVDLRLGDATEVIPTLAGPFDFVLFDSFKTMEGIQLGLLLPKLAADVLVLADNALSHSEEMAPYLARVAAQADFDHLVVPVGKGLSVAYRKGRRSGEA